MDNAQFQQLVSQVAEARAKSKYQPLPANFQLTNDRYEYALLELDSAGLLAPDLTPEQQAAVIQNIFDKFMDTALRSSETKVSWDRAWQAYCRKWPLPTR